MEGLTAVDCDWSIECGESSLVQDCIAENNGEGIEVGDKSIVRNCIARGNDNLGFYLGDGSSATACLAANNGNYGYILGNGSSITNSVAKDSGTVGIGALQSASSPTAAVGQRHGRHHDRPGLRGARLHRGRVRAGTASR